MNVLIYFNSVGSIVVGFGGVVIGNCWDITSYNVSLNRNGVQIHSVSVPSSETFVVFDNVGLGEFFASVSAFDEFFNLCGTVHSETIFNAMLDCIPINHTNLSFSTLRNLYSLPNTNVLLSGPNNPSTGLSIFGQSGLPASGGSSNRARPNAVSELRGSCILSSNPQFAYTVGFTFFGSTSNDSFTVTTIRLQWTSVELGSVTSAPQDGNVRINVSLTHFNISGAVVNPTPFEARIRRIRNNSTSTLHTVFRRGSSNGNVSNTFDIDLLTNDILEVELFTQSNPFNSNCGGIMFYRTFIEIVQYLQNNSLVLLKDNIIDSTINLSSNPCPATCILNYEFDMYRSSLNSANRVNGRYEIRVNNVLQVTLTESGSGSLNIAVGASVNIRVIYDGSPINSSITSPSLTNFIRNETNGNIIINNSSQITSGTSSTLQHTFTLPSTPSTIFALGRTTGIDTIQCQNSLNFGNTGRAFPRDFIIQLGLDTGISRLLAEPFGIPDRIQVIWNGNVVIDTGYISNNTDANTTWLNTLNTELIRLGQPTVSSINIIPSGLREVGSFNKTAANPSTAIVRVFAPLEGTAINFHLRCVGT